MSILAMCRYRWLDGQEVPRSYQTAYLALEARFFDCQVASWLLPTLPLCSSIPPGSITAEPTSFEAHFGWSTAHFGWTAVDPVARSPKALCMQMMYLNYLA